MYGVRLIGTNKWILRIPGHSKVLDAVGSTWSKPPVLESFYNEEVQQHVCAIDGLDDFPANNSDMRPLIAFETNPSKYLEVIKVAFKEVP